MLIKKHDWQDPLITGAHRVLTHSSMGAYADVKSAKGSKLSETALKVKH